jgi:hypothetical protein
MKDETTRIPTAHWVMVRASGSDLPGPLSMQEKVFFFSLPTTDGCWMYGWHISSADANSMKLPVACGKNPGCQIGSHQFPVQLVFCLFVVYFVVYNFAPFVKPIFELCVFTCGSSDTNFQDWRLFCCVHNN